MQLVRYDAARQALAEAHRVDEVKDLRDKAEALAAYARQARDNDMLQWATEIKVRAERKAGELLRQTAERGERHSGHGNNRPKLESDNTTPTPPTLSDLNITRDQSSRWQKLATMPEEHFETAVATAKEHVGQVTTAHLLRVARAPDPKPAPPGDAASRLYAKGSPLAAMTTAAQIRLLIERISPADPNALTALDQIEAAIHRHRATVKEHQHP